MNAGALNELARVVCEAQAAGRRTPMGIAMAVESAVVEPLRARVAELEAEQHTTNEALPDAAEALRAQQDRITELEQREASVAAFVAERAGYITAIRNCHPDNGHDYDRWQGHAAARRQLSELLGLPVAWPPEDSASVEKSTAKLKQVLAPTQVLREEGEHYASVHHDCLVGRDLPETGGAQ